MAIENNLPIIFDCATHSEDGLMSYADKIKLDNLEIELDKKIDKTAKIPSSMLDTSRDDNKIKLNNLSDEVRQAMIGNSPISQIIENGSVTNEKLAPNVVDLDKVDKRLLRGTVVSPTPINFVFDTKKVTITVPEKTYLLLDSVTKRPLVTESDTKEVVVNLNYPTVHNGLNVIVSLPSGSLSFINSASFDTINNASTIIAFVMIDNANKASVVMDGSFTINGLRQGLGTESAGLFGTGSIVLDAKAGIIDFTNAQYLSLVVGGVFDKVIQNQASIRIADYSIEQIYCLYWDRKSEALKAISVDKITDTDINKIAIIKDGLIVPFVPSGLFKSKPYIEAPYYNETYDAIETIAVVSKLPLNFNMETSMLEFPNETYVLLNEQNLLVKNTEATFENRDGLHFILFDLDAQTLSIRHYKTSKEDKKNVLIGTFWLVQSQKPVVSGAFAYTINGKSDYENDIKQTTDRMNAVEAKLDDTLPGNKLLVPTDIYLISGEELPVYKSSLLIKDTEGLATAISYNQGNSVSKPRVEFFDSFYLDSGRIGSNVTFDVKAKFNTESFMKKSVKINSVMSNANNGKAIKLLMLGDNIINDNVASLVKNELISYGMSPKMLGTMVNSNVAGEGRDGWFYSTFVGASGRGVKPGKINPQVSKATSTILMNPFLRIATADDKAKYPNICFRQTGAYTEKSYYSDSNKNGAFYIFDFSAYLEVQGIEDPDIITISIDPASSLVFTENNVSVNMNALRQMIESIRLALPNVIIGIVPQYGMNINDKEKWEKSYMMILEIIEYVRSLADANVKVIPTWIHQCRDFAYSADQDPENNTIYSYNNTNAPTELSKYQYANSVSAFIMNQ